MVSPPRRRWWVLVCALPLFLRAAAARAEPPPTPGADTPAPPPRASGPGPEPGADLRALTQPVDLDKHLLGSLEFGRGLRFNNPYRLATELGASASSLSSTAAYADLGIGITFGSADGLQHGGAVHASFAMTGVPQATITPGYMIAYRGPRAFMGYGRLGPSFVLTPDPTIGGEVAAGFAWFVTGKVAIAGELVFDIYYGAGTHHVGIATYPVLSGQLGLLFDQEFLP